jgi:pyruvate dehydrogenase E2 component (dihydrolipoamide acetyltransferase)
VVETQKGAIDVEIWQDGRVAEIVVEPGAKVPVGTVLALLDVEGEAAARVVQSEAAHAVTLPPVAAPARAGSAPAAPRPRASPAARRRALELGVDLAQVTPSSPGGIIESADVERAAKSVTAPAPAAGDWQSAMRQAIAAAMAKSKREIPHYYLGTEIDMTRALAWLEAENARLPVAERMLYAVLLVKALALALREVPELNGFWTDGAYHAGPGIHVGMAIAMRGGGLVAPAIHDADRKPLPELMAALRDLITRVRGGRLKSSELADPTITLTSLGDQGAEEVYGVIYPPQVAIVGFGRVTERLRPEKGQVVCRRVVTATLAGDHRASDGHRGGLLLAAIDRLLQEPEKLACL